MANRKDTRAYGDAATSSEFPVTGKSWPPVDNVSGAPSPNTVRFPRDDSAITASPPGPAPGYPYPILIDGGTSGPDLGDLTEHALARAARYASARRMAGESSTAPLDQGYLDHVFGKTLPGRGRA